MQFAHSNGQTHCFWQKDFIYTGGSDNLINRFHLDGAELTSEPKYMADELPTWRNISALTVHNVKNDWYLSFIWLG